MNQSATSPTWVNRKFLRPAVIGIAAVLAFLIVAWFLYMGYHVYDLSRAAKEIQQQEKIQLDYDWAKLVHRIAGDVNAIHAGLSPLYPVLRLLPDQTGPGHLLRQVELFSRYAVELTNCGAIVFDGIQPILTMMQDKSVSVDAEKIIGVLSSQTSAFQEAQKYYQSAADIRSALDPMVLPSSIKNYYDKFDVNFGLLGFGLDILQNLPSLAGQNQSKVYLVLAQNYDELRATGGFISGIGTIEIAAGKIQNFNMSDSYSIDDFTKSYPRPPMPIERFMLGGVWVARDANWSPDFPTAARNTQDLYTLSTGKLTDGVIAFDQAAVRELVAIFEPLNIPSLNSPITAANIEQYMHDAWAPDNPAAFNKEWWLHRKDFMKEMGSELLRAMIECRDVNQLIAMAGTVRNLIRSGHLLAFFNSADIQSAFSKADLAGELNFQNNASFMLVDSNIGFNKMDSVVKRSLDFQLDVSDLSNPVATITVNYENPVKKAVVCKHTASYGDGTYADMQNRCYWNYWRIYLPARSEMISISTSEIPPEWLLNKETVHNPVEVSKGEGGAVVIGGMMVIPTNANQQIVLKVRLPQQIFSSADNGQKTLDLEIFKQPGIQALPVNISAVIPANAILCPNSNLGLEKIGNQISWKETITQTYEQSLCLSSIN